jgi:tetratricopeptide (TPR) repeat protein
MSLLGHILTFYSYKGGVGRSMGLANVATLFAKWRRRVLVIDWDLEAPGLEAYFNSHNPSIAERRKNTPGVIDLVKAVEEGQQLDWHDCLISVHPFGEEKEEEFKLISAGKNDGNYMSRVQHTNWDYLFDKNNLGTYIEDLRNAWKNEFDLILVDSRTGINDIGGICTIHLPDYLLIWFTTNETGMDGAKNVAESARLAQDNLPFDRNPLVVLPVPARDESRTEFKKSEQWKEIITEKFGGFYKAWLSDKSTPQEVVEKVRIPYIAYWSFGENLPVVEEGTEDPQGIGWAYEILSKLIFFNFDWSKIEFAPEHSYEYLSRAVEVDKGRFGPEYAELLYDKALGLQREGRPGDSMEYVREAVNILEDIVETDFKTYGPKLAQVRLFLSDRLSEENDIIGSIFEANEAVGIYRRLYEINSVEFEEDLGTSITILWERLSASGDTERTIDTIQSTIDLQRHLARLNPDANAPGLASGLFNLSNLLIETNQFSEALAFAQEAVEVYRSLAATNRARYEQDLASSLQTLSECLFNVNDIEGALAAGKEAVDIFSVLAQKEPRRYERDVASSLNALLDPITQLNLDDVPEALVFIRNSLNVFRDLAKEAKRYAPDLAKNLNILPELLLGKSVLKEVDLQEALAVQEEAIEIFRHLIPSNPSLHEPELASSLLTLAKILYRKGDRARARDAGEEAREIFERLSRGGQIHYTEELDEVSKILNQ